MNFAKITGNPTLSGNKVVSKSIRFRFNGPLSDWAQGVLDESATLPDPPSQTQDISTGVSDMRPPGKKRPKIIKDTDEALAKQFCGEVSLKRPAVIPTSSPVTTLSLPTSQLASTRSSLPASSPSASFENSAKKLILEHAPPQRRRHPEVRPYARGSRAKAIEDIDDPGVKEVMMAELLDNVYASGSAQGHASMWGTWCFFHRRFFL